MSKRKQQDFPKLSLAIAAIALLFAVAAFAFSIYEYKEVMRPTTLSGLVESRLNKVQSELDDAKERLAGVEPSNGNLTRLQDMITQAEVLYDEAEHNWVQYNLTEAEREVLQAENIIHKFNAEPILPGVIHWSVVGWILAGVFILGLLGILLLMPRRRHSKKQ